MSGGIPPDGTELISTGEAGKRRAAHRGAGSVLVTRRQSREAGSGRLVPAEKLWKRVLSRKGGHFAVVARMPIDPSVN